MITTYTRIEKALNLRFEVDSSLYISKEDTEKIKKSLFKNEYQNIRSFSQKFGRKIVAKVIIKNAYLVNFSTISFHDKKVLNEIFKGLDEKYLTVISDELMNDKIYSSIQFKNFIRKFSLKILPILQCAKIYKDKSASDEERLICFRRFLLEEYKVNNSVNNFIQFINLSFNDYPDLYKYIQNKHYTFLSEIFENLEANDKVIVSQWIIENKIKKQTEKLWEQSFLSIGETAFMEAFNYVSKYPEYKNEIIQTLIRKFFPRFLKFKKVDNEFFKAKIIELYRNCYDIRILFLHMLEPKNFRDSDEPLIISIADRFETIGVKYNHQENLEKVRNWNKKEFSTKDDLIDEILKPTTNLTYKKTLDYFSSNLNEILIKELLSDYRDKKNIQILLSYYFSTIILGDKRGVPDWYIELDLHDDIKEKIATNIESYYINTAHSRRFLAENQYYNILEKFNKR